MPSIVPVAPSRSKPKNADIKAIVYLHCCFSVNDLILVINQNYNDWLGTQNIDVDTKVARFS